MIEVVAMVNIGRLPDGFLTIDNAPHGVLLPIPNLLLVLSQTKVSSYERLPAAVQKAALLAAPLPVRLEPPTHVPFTAKHPALRLSPLAKVEVAPVR